MKNAVSEHNKFSLTLRSDKITFWAVRLTPPKSLDVFKEEYVIKVKEDANPSFYYFLQALPQIMEVKQTHTNTHTHTQPPTHTPTNHQSFSGQIFVF